MENCIRQNNAIDIYEDYYGDLSIDRSSDPPAAKTINIFRYCLPSGLVSIFLTKITTVI